MLQVQGTTPLWIAARILLYERVDDFFRRKEKVLQTFDAEDIHDVRVASRRLREGLVLFAPCYPPEDIRRLIRRAKRVTRLLGEIRNLDEAGSFFAGIAQGFPASSRDEVARFAASFAGKRKPALKKLKTGLRNLAPDVLRSRYMGIISSPALFSPRGDVDLFASVASFAKNSMDEPAVRISELLSAAVKDMEIESQHLLRIEVKHFRYRMEILSFLIEPAFPELHGRIKEYQEVLGKMHDLDVFSALVRSEGVSESTAALVLSALAAERGKFFTGFCSMVREHPLDYLCEQARRAI